MPIRNDNQTRFSDEIRGTPLWAGILATLGFLGMQFLFLVVMSHDKNAPRPAIRLFLGLLAGTVIACYFLFLGYISRDARRRGMNPLLWTLIAVFVPNGIGIILFFVLRKPLPSICPQCGAGVQLGFGFCPRCRYHLQPVCPHCQRGVEPGSVYCPYCGGGMNAPPTSASVQTSSPLP
jgi:Double zinc ribbon